MLLGPVSVLNPGKDLVFHVLLYGQLQELTFYAATWLPHPAAILVPMLFPTQARLGAFALLLH